MFSTFFARIRLNHHKRYHVDGTFNDYYHRFLFVSKRLVVDTCGCDLCVNRRGKILNEFCVCANANGLLEYFSTFLCYADEPHRIRSAQNSPAFFSQNIIHCCTAKKVRKPITSTPARISCSRAAKMLWMPLSYRNPCDSLAALFAVYKHAQVLRKAFTHMISCTRSARVTRQQSQARASNFLFVREKYYL